MIHEISVPKLGLLKAMMQKKKGGHLKTHVKTNVDGQHDNKRIQNVNQDWPHDKKHDKKHESHPAWAFWANKIVFFVGKASRRGAFG